MSINSKQKIRCASCGSMHDMTIWTSITVSDSEDLKRDLLAGKINMLICPDCGYRALVSTPLLYDDEAKKLMISFYPTNDAALSRKAFSDMQENMKASGELDKYYGYNLRYVSEYNSLLEKIIISDNGLWDKVIEVLKLLILSQEPDKEKDRSAVFGKLDGDTLEFMITDRAEGQVYVSRVPMASYKSIEAELRASGVKPYSFNWEQVDTDYAGAMLGGINNY